MASMSGMDRDPQAHYARGCALQAGGQHEAAAASYRCALDLDPRHWAAHINLGCILQAGWERAGSAASATQLEEARAHFHAAAQCNPGDTAAWINLGYSHERSRELAEARRCYDRALKLDAGAHDARFARSMVLLAQGDWLEGWQEYEFRWQASGYARPAYPQPEWDGRALDGETVLLYTEQGFGDAIQFVRYAALVAARGGRAVVRCPPELERLLRGAPGVAATFTPEKTVPFDLHGSLLSLPRLLRTTPETVPAQLPYLRADPALVEKWRARVDAGAPGQRVGLAWASHSQMPNAPLKSMPPQALEPLRGISGVRYFSLQAGEAGRRAAAAAPLRIADLTDGLLDFAETAALIASLDLVISVDTAVAHLAGALGRPVWTVLSFAPDWRWYPDAASSRWYPGMRLYRQPRHGDWAAACAQVAQDLRRAGLSGPT
jgi:hypothetical protein